MHLVLAVATACLAERAPLTPGAEPFLFSSSPCKCGLFVPDRQVVGRSWQLGGRMALEIERKFLVANDGWKNSVVGSVRIRDGLIANNKGHKARVRIAGDVATIALKSRR